MRFGDAVHRKIVSADQGRLQELAKDLQRLQRRLLFKNAGENSSWLTYCYLPALATSDFSVGSR
jgi:hypothetical protein